MEWNEEYECLVDYMGLPLSRTEAKNIMELAKAHLKHTPKQLTTIKVTLAVKLHPGSIHNVSDDPKDME